MAETTSEKRLQNAIFMYMCLFTGFFFLAIPFACLDSGEGLDVFSHYWRLLTSPSKLITDYFALGSMGATFLNAAVCGLFCNVVTWLSKARTDSMLLAGYFLVVAHCFYGLNIINMIPPFLGVFVYSLVMRRPFHEDITLAMFATSLGPFISDFLFRYPNREVVFGEPNVTLTGILIAVSFSILAGFLIPALMPGTSKMHEGHNLYKAGLAIGLFGMFAHGFFYNTLDVPTPDRVYYPNDLYTMSGEDCILFADVFFFVVFAVTFVLGYLSNGKSFKHLKKLWLCDSWQDDFPEKFGIGPTLINVAIYGFCVLLYVNAAFFLTEGVGFTGPTVGVVIAAITFSAAGQTPRNVWPIALGYAILYGFSLSVCALSGRDLSWTLTTQVYINGLAFATGLCPFAGRYGWKVGVAAGILHAILCTSTAAMHGGFVLYNGGLTSGLTAMLLLPILNFYEIKPKRGDL